MLNSEYALLLVSIQAILYFPWGFLLVERPLRSIPLFIKLPIFIAVGMLVTDLILSFTAIFYIGKINLFLITGIAYAIVIFRLLSARHPIELKNLIQSVRSINKYSIASFIVMILVISYFSFVAGYLGWPPAGDVIVHGFLTSLLIKNQALQGTLTPVEPNESWPEPFGLHVLASNFSLSFDLYPAISLFIIATAIVILILLLIYAIVYMLTKSILFSIIALMSGFYISSLSNVEYWLIGYYYNGPYANLFGYLAILVYVLFQFVISSVLRKTSKRISIATLISMLAIMVIYPPFAILPLLHLLITNIVKRRGKLKEIINSVVHNPYQKTVTLFSSKKTTALSIIIICSIILSSYFYIFHVLGVTQSLTLTGISTSIERLHRWSFGYSLSDAAFLSDMTGPLTLLTMVSAVIAIIKRKYVHMSTFYLAMSTAVVLSVWDVTSKYLWFILPKRIFIFLTILDWILILTYLYLLLVWLIPIVNRRISSRKRIYGRSYVRYLLYAVITIPIAALLVDSIISHAFLEQADRGAWFPRSESFRNNYPILAWINNNIDENDLIMVDGSFSSLFIDSLSIKNLTISPSGASSGSAVERGLENYIVWERPELMKQFIASHDVKYVVLLTERIEKNPLPLGGDGTFHTKKYDASEYHNLLAKMKYLKPVKANGFATVYEVEPRQM